MNEPVPALPVHFRSRLDFDEITRIVDEQAPDFRALDGLQQKYYLQATAAGEIAGLCPWDSAEALDSYQAEGEPRVEVYRVLDLLRDSPG